MATEILKSNVKFGYEVFLPMYLGQKFQLRINDTDQLSAEMEFTVDALKASLLPPYHPDGINPILLLRPIGSMTNDEFKEWGGNFLFTTYEAICSPLPFKDRPKHVIVLENRINTNTLSFIEGVFLASKGFDLFGLIKAGIAFEKPQT